MPKSSNAVRAVGQHEQVAAVQVAVEDAVDQRPFHEGDHPGADHGLGVDPGVAHAGGVVEAEPGHPLHHQDTARHELRMRSRDHVAVLVEVTQHGGDVEHVGRFHAEVELLDDRLGEQLDECRRVGQGGDRDAADEVGRQPRHDPQVVAHETVDGGPLDLDDDVLAGAQPRPVDLGDRRRRERRAVERLEHVLEARPEILLDGPAHVVERLGGDLVAAFLELVDQLRREQALTRRDDLAELDVGRPEVLGGQPQPARDVAATGLDRRVLPASLAPQPGDEGDGEPGDDGDHTAAGRDPCRSGELRHLRLGGGTKPCRARQPGRLVAVDDPRGVLGERRPLAVGRVRHGPQDAGICRVAIAPVGDGAITRIDGRRPTGARRGSGGGSTGPGLKVEHRRRR